MTRASARMLSAPNLHVGDESDAPSLPRPNARPYGAYSACTSHPAGQTLTVRVPFRITPRGGRKLVIGPAGPQSLSLPERVDCATVKAIARAFRWRKLIETGVYDSVGHIARVEKINASYVSRILRLTLLAPEIVEAIIDGRCARSQLGSLMNPFPLEWTVQVGQFT